ncbi:hypothetical protein G5V59_27445 [Nocardioides sp. W3-2-3]|uniref:thermonuclease family protein n=1 Tax=Nocardioides convexus TaxID=2712224 RepID=UPI002418B6DD|nr:hypothetical protein [Nocardioides convexus]NHA02118.1 hypothetical protein [Nocardioides convexus]
MPHTNAGWGDGQRLRRTIQCAIAVAVLSAVGLVVQHNVGDLLDRAEGGQVRTTSAVVVRVVDGDTLIVSRPGANTGREERVRILGINAPETAHDGRPAECYGPQATKILEQSARRRRPGPG